MPNPKQMSLWEDPAPKPRRVNPHALNDMSARDWIKFTKSWFVLPASKPDAERTALHPATFPMELALDFVEFFTKPGDMVLDPFAGTGTTLEAAERIGRRAVGIELNPQFAEFAKSRSGCAVVCSDAMSALKDPERFAYSSVDYLFTSPPYWNMLRRSRGGNDDTRHRKRQAQGQALVYSDDVNDLGNINEPAEFVRCLVAVFDKAYRVLKPGAYCTVVLQNVNHEGAMVPIAWQFAIAMAGTGLWQLKGERIWCKDQGRLGIYGYPTTYATNNVHHYCLSFRRQ